jgi:hypothetical protein
MTPVLATPTQDSKRAYENQGKPRDDAGKPTQSVETPTEDSIKSDHNTTEATKHDAVSTPQNFNYKSPEKPKYTKFKTDAERLDADSTFHFLRR